MPMEKTVSGKAIRVNRINKGERCLEVMFVNNEFPKADLEFTFDGRRWHLYDGKNYKLPLHVVEHLNSLKIPESRYEEDPKTGQMTHIVTVMRPRFTCQPINLGALLDAKREVEKGSKKEKSSEEEQEEIDGR